jgi:hypothetical protein
VLDRTKMLSSGNGGVMTQPRNLSLWLINGNPVPLDAPRTPCCGDFRRNGPAAEDFGNANLPVAILSGRQN